MRQQVARIRGSIISPNLLDVEANARAKLLLYCDRYQFTDHEALQLQIRQIISKADLRLSNDTPLKAALPIGDDTTTSATEVVGWVERNLAKKPRDCTTLKSRIDTLHDMAYAAKVHGVGNCGELSACMYTCLSAGMEEFNLCRLEYINLDNHALVVVNRSLKSSILDFEAWGKSAIVVDAWTGEAFYIHTALANDAIYKALCRIELSDSFEVFAHKKFEPANPQRLFKPERPTAPKQKRPLIEQQHAGAAKPAVL